MFQCKDLFTLSSLSKLKLLSDSSGLHKGIRWVYKAESLHLSNWVHGGELLIISKLVTSEPEFNLKALLSEAIKLNMSGALLLIGPGYVRSISKSVINLCNKHSFPLFGIPWNLPLVNFFEEIGYAIANSNFHQNNKDDVISSIIFENHPSSSLLELQAMNAGYTLEGVQRFFLLHFSLPDSGRTAGMEQSISGNIWEYLQQTFSQAEVQILSSCYSNHIIGMVSNEDTEQIKPVFESILSYILKTYPELTCNIGLGLPMSEFDNLKRSYEQAAKCIIYCSKQNYNQQIVDYEQLGLYQLFSDLNRMDMVEAFIHRQLGALIEYDATNHTQLVDTLYFYLENNCNLLHTADAMYTHRNTIKYRLSRIEEITHYNLQDADIRLNLHVALYLRKFVL